MQESFIYHIEEGGYNQFAHENEFYLNCKEDSYSEESFTDVDSGYNTARNGVIPVEQLINQLRNTTKVNTYTNHALLSLADLPRAPCLFQVINDKVQFHRLYTKTTELAEGLFPMYLNLAQSYKQTHDNWITLLDFAEAQRRIKEKPAFIVCWLEVFDEFVYDFTRRITQLKTKLKSPVQVILEARPICTLVDFLSSIISPVKAAKNWKFDHVELAWTMLLSSISDESLLSEDSKIIALKLQKAFYSVILEAMDRLYYFGEISDGVKVDFIIYSDPSKTAKFNAHSVPSHTVLWTSDVIKTVHRGAILRQRLGIHFNVKSASFSECFTKLIPDWQTKITPLSLFRPYFHRTCYDFTERLGEELFKSVMEGGLIAFWHDVKNITIGTAACSFAKETFNLEKTISPVKAFMHSLKVGNVSNTANWIREEVDGHTGQIRCEIPEALAHIISESLIATMNTILDRWLILSRANSILVAVLTDKEIIVNNNKHVQRHFRFLISNLHNMLNIIRNDYYHRTMSIFNTTENEINNVKSYYEAEIFLRRSEKTLLQLVDVERDFSSKTLWSIVSTFSFLIDDIRLKSLSNNVDKTTLKSWRQKLLCIYESIRSTDMLPESSGSCSTNANGKVTLKGYLYKIEVRAMGLIARRKHWFALSDTSNYLYWFKDPNDVHCIGRLPLRGAAFTYNPIEKGRFEIHAGTEVYKFEASTQQERDDWLQALQNSRKLSFIETLPRDTSDIISLRSSQISDGDGENSITSSTMELFKLLGPRESEESDDTGEENRGANAISCFSSKNTDISELLPVVPASTFYLDTNGELNDRSMQLPEEHEGVADSVLRKISEKTTDTRAMKALAKTKKTIMSIRDCDECRKRSSESETWEEKCRDFEDHVSSLENMVKVLKTGLITAQRQLDTIQTVETLNSDDGLKKYLLDKEHQITYLQLENNALHKKVQSLETENRNLDAKVSELLSAVDAFRDSVRSKEELIMRIFEENNQEIGPVDDHLICEVVGVPEAILLDNGAIVRCDEEAGKVFEAVGVRDINELKDLVEGYKSQNRFLSNEVVELHKEIGNLLKVGDIAAKKSFEVEGCYYQLKSRYLLVLNHFKTPETPGKIMQPGVLRQLLEESNQAPKDVHQTDTLGFYLKGKSERQAPTDDLLDIAAEYMEKANDMVQARSLEQSEEYMNWLQSWDGFLVNNVGKPFVPSQDLKNLVRTGIPPTYRSRVWKGLVSLIVKDKISELGNGYFSSMLKKATNKIDEGIYDSAIKQIDLDLARTLPTNKFFDEPGSTKIEMLRRVLYAFRYHNKAVGYCQGLNRLAAIALLYLDEEDAFWFMVACVEYLQPEGYYTSSLIGAVADQKVLRDLVTEKLPKLAVHLKNLEVDLSLFALGWFLTCFVDILPHSVYLNIFDIFLYEGNKAIFRFALALLKKCENSVLQCKTIGTVHACLSRVAECDPDFKSLAQIAFNDMNPFPQKMIETKRTQYLSQLREQGYS